MTSEQSILTEMKLQNLIKDSDSMEYITPNKEYKIVVDRYDSSIISPDGGNTYIIDTKVYDTCGVNIVSFKMNECDCIRMLDCMDSFINDFDGSIFNNYISVALSPEQGSFFVHVIELRKLDICSQIEYGTLPEYYKDYKNNDYRDYQIEISRHSPVTSRPISLFNFICSEQEYLDFMFTYFFVGLLDIAIPKSIENIANTIINGSYGHHFGMYPYNVKPDGTIIN